MALALISDLMTSSQAASAAQRAGTTLDVALSVDALVAKAEATRPTLVIVDLSHPNLDVAAAIARLKPLLAPGGAILAFGPHVQHERLEAARAAGCDAVISRGEFHAKIEQILAQRAG
jgi:AmiR/NasT family two-component response regulator